MAQRVFMSIYVHKCLLDWIHRFIHIIRDRTLYSANTFLEGLHVEKSSRSSVTKKWLTARMIYSGKESILTLVMRLLNLNQSFSKVNVCKDYLLQRGASTSRVTWRWFVLLFRALEFTVSRMAVVRAMLFFKNSTQGEEVSRLLCKLFKKRKKKKKENIVLFPSTCCLYSGLVT